MLAFWRTTMGKKIVMAVTGVILIAFLVGHVTGNLLVFRGAGALDAYSAFKREMAALWVVRAILFAAVVLHVVAAAQLKISIDTIARMNRDWLAASIAPGEKSRSEGTP